MWIAGLLLLSAGCNSVTFDLSDIEEPVMLNPMPYPGVSWTVNELDPFIASATSASGGASHPGTTTSTRMHEDDAQLRAFESIGGHSQRMIIVDNVQVWGGGGNFLIVFAEMSSVDVRGRVLEVGALSTPDESADSGDDQ